MSSFRNRKVSKLTMMRAAQWKKSRSYPGAEYCDGWWIFPRRERWIFRWWDVHHVSTLYPDTDIRDPWNRYAGGFFRRRTAKLWAEKEMSDDAKHPDHEY